MIYKGYEIQDHKEMGWYCVNVKNYWDCFYFNKKGQNNKWHIPKIKITTKKSLFKAIDLVLNSTKSTLVINK
jgi:hypothetical protein|tara:strand:- start:532 stop:747 length:216 start_codon:yes stop_codon:yes gene_type:complete